LQLSEGFSKDDSPASAGNARYNAAMSTTLSDHQLGKSVVLVNSAVRELSWALKAFKTGCC
jgi:hypothetical protein